ncbi:MAG: hypothetical protein A3F41_00365 [Coxiella sp. RIFCSPHIGHO2_12_FULL_44_14]|nr:MAG: hypothetical protein A3F41_00365 [Coxiella sp. RIFCSPHIGHO2_12_FULL_44_14]
MTNHPTSLFKRCVVEVTSVALFGGIFVIDVVQRALKEKFIYLEELTHWSLIFNILVGIRNLYAPHQSTSSQAMTQFLPKTATTVAGHVMLLFWTLQYSETTHKNAWLVLPHGGTWLIWIVRNLLLGENLHTVKNGHYKEALISTLKNSGPAVMFMGTYGLAACVVSISQEGDIYPAIPWNSDWVKALIVSVLGILATPVTALFSQLTQEAVRKVLPCYFKKPMEAQALLEAGMTPRTF